MAEDLMETMVRMALWQQFAAAIDMLENVVVACPETLWQEHLWSDAEEPHYGTFWEIISHTLFWLDLYLTAEREGFASPMPFIWNEQEIRRIPSPTALSQRGGTRLSHTSAQEVSDDDHLLVRRAGTPTDRAPFDQGKADELFRASIVFDAPRAGTCGPTEPLSRAARHRGRAARLGRVSERMKWVRYKLRDPEAYEPLDSLSGIRAQRLGADGEWMEEDTHAGSHVMRNEMRNLSSKKEKRSLS